LLVFAEFVGAEIAADVKVGAVLRPQAHKNARQRPRGLRKEPILQYQARFLNWLEFGLGPGDYD